MKRLVTAVALIAAMPAAFALSTASARLSLGYSLFDLDKHDGITPGLFINPANQGTAVLYGLMSVVGNDLSERNAYGLEPTAAGVGGSDTNFATVRMENPSPSSFVVNADLSADGYFLDDFDGYPTEFDVYVSTYYGSSGGFTLTPNTRIEWTARYSLDAQSTAQSRFLYLGNPEYEPQFVTEHSSINLGWEVYLGDYENVNRRTFELNNGESLSGRSVFSYSNLSADPISMNVGMWAGGNGVGILAPVPEPETYGLMALGVGLVGWQVRRRRSA